MKLLPPRRDVALRPRRDERRLRPGPERRLPAAEEAGLRFTGDTIARYEWTNGHPARLAVGRERSLTDQSRYVLQARPRRRGDFGPVEARRRGAFNYSGDKNYVPPLGEPLPLIRDNYKSRDARVDLALAKLTLGPVVRRAAAS